MSFHDMVPKASSFALLLHFLFNLTNAVKPVKTFACTHDHIATFAEWTPAAGSAGAMPNEEVKRARKKKI